jgi:hypothetical protein
MKPDDERQGGWLLVTRGYYWRPDGRGYTSLKAEAGKWDVTVAKIQCDKGGPHSAIHEDDAPDFVGLQGMEAEMRELRSKVVELTARLYAAEYLAKGAIPPGLKLYASSMGQFEPEKCSLFYLENDAIAHRDGWHGSKSGVVTPVLLQVLK